MSFDLVIRGGTVIDGSGLGSFRGDIGVVGDRIAAVGRIAARGREEIDAEGQVVTPGFIDGHTHLDAQLFWDPHGVNSCWHGVTTAVMGNCGFTLAPVRSEERALVVRNLERAEDIDPAALDAGIDWSWQTFPEYLDAVDRAPKAIHYAANVGHSALRTWAMGERAFEEPANDNDLTRMSNQLEAALRAGAIGFSTSRTEHHETSDGRPVASRLADWSEVLQLAGVMSRLGAGLLEGGTEGTISDDPEVREHAWNHVRQVAVGLGVPVTGGLIATASAGPRTLEMLDVIAAEGGRVIGQTHCRGISVLLSFKTNLPFDRLPEWQSLRALPLAGHRRHARQLRQLARHRRHASQAGLRWDSCLRPRPAAQSDGARSGRAAWCVASPGDDRVGAGE